MEDFHESLTKDDEKSEMLLRCVQEHTNTILPRLYKINVEKIF